MELDCRSTMGTWPERYDQQLLGASTSLVTVDRDEVVTELTEICSTTILPTVTIVRFRNSKNHDLPDTHCTNTHIVL